MFKTQVSLFVLVSMMASFVQPAYAGKTKRYEPTDRFEDTNPTPPKKAKEEEEEKEEEKEKEPEKEKEAEETEQESSSTLVDLFCQMKQDNRKSKIKGRLRNSRKRKSKEPQENPDKSDLGKLPFEIQQNIFVLALGGRGSQARETYKNLRAVDRTRNELVSDDFVLAGALKLSEPLYPHEDWRFSGGFHVSWVRFMFDLLNQINTSYFGRAKKSAEILLKGLEKNPKSPILLYYFALTSLAAHFNDNSPLSGLLKYLQSAHDLNPDLIENTIENTRQAKLFFYEALLADREQKKSFDILKYQAYLTLHFASSVGHTNDPNALEAEINEITHLCSSKRFDEVSKFDRAQIRLFALLTPQQSQRIPLLEVSASLGDPEAQFFVANYYLTGKIHWDLLPPLIHGEPKLPNSHLRWVEISENEHHPHYREALYQRAVFYWPYGSPDREGIVPKSPLTSLEFLTKAAELGHQDAQKRLIDVYSHGAEEIKENSELARKWLIKAAKQGSPQASYTLANALIVEENRDEAIHWLIKAAQGGHRQAMLDLSKCYSGGIGVPQDEDETIYWLTRYAQSGDAEVAYDLAQFYLQKDESKTIHWLIQAMTHKHKEAEALLTTIAEKGNIEAKFRLGFFLFSRRISPKKGKDLMCESAQLGFTAAMRRLGVIFSQGEFRVTKDEHEGAIWFLQAVERGDRIAVQELTSLVERSRHLFENNPFGQLILGKYYFSCLKDVDKGLSFVLSAASNGFRAAQCYLSKCCLEGNQVEKNAAKAASWFLASKMDDSKEEREIARQIVQELEVLAHQGDNTSQFNLSRFYLEDSGVDVDIPRGFSWLQLAAWNGHEEASRQLFTRFPIEIPQNLEEDVLLSTIMNIEVKDDDDAAKAANKSS